VLDGSGVFQPIPIGADGIYRSAVLPNFWLNVNWLWETNFNPLTALGQIVGIEHLIQAIQSEAL
jgi:hypothetical protein